MSGSILERVTAVVVSYNTRDVLQASLATLTEGALGLDVVVVDNASTDGSADAARAAFPGLTVIDAGRNLGFGAAVNLGAAATKRDFLLTLNPDCLVTPAAVAELAERLAADSRLGFAGPRILMESGALDHAAMRADPDPLGALLYFSRLPRLFPGRPGLNRYSLAHADQLLEQDLAAGTGACLMFRVSAFRQVGGFDEDFFMYGEDLDLCRRVREAGYRGRYVPAAVVTHIKGEASRQRSRAMLVEFHRAMWTYYRKHEAAGRPAPYNALVRGAIMALAALRLALNAVRREKRVSSRE